MISAGVIRTILVIDIIALALLAVFYLRQRRMSWTDYCLWSLIALLLPVLGPFLVISNRPGTFDPDLDLRKDLNRAASRARQWFSARPAGIYNAVIRLEVALKRRQPGQSKTRE